MYYHFIYFFMKSKKKLNLKIDCEEISEMEKSIFSEIGSDGLRFLRQDLHISSEGLMKIGGSHISCLLETTKQTLQTNPESILGKGSACIVEQGIYKPLQIQVAIKTINIYDQNKRHQIMNDIKILLSNLIDEERNGVKCHFIVTLYGAYFDQGKVKVILELMDAGSIENIINLYKKAKVKPNIPQSILAKIAVQILCGMTYLHSKNQIHRDIKPGNILINMKGEVKLSDFGISKQFIEGKQFSKTSVGTRTYMSPQRIQGSHYSYKSDVWGLGLVLYELATAEFPYDNRSQFDLRRDFVKIGVPKLPNKYSELLGDFINKSLAINEEDRADAFELLSHKWILKNIGLKANIRNWLYEIKETLIPIISLNNL